MRPGSRTKVSGPLVLTQNRHPERSASQIGRVTQRLGRGVEGPRRCLIYPCCSELFNRGLKFKTFHRLPSSAYRSRSCCRASVVEKLRAA